MYQIRHYLTHDEKDIYLDWFSKLRDMTAKIAINRRVNRIEKGSFGDHKFCRDGIWELRIDIGAGYPECITLSQGKKSSYCYALAIKERKLLISTVLANTGKIGNGERTMKDRLHDDAMAELYRNDPAYAIEFLNSILADGDQQELLIALRQMTQAFGGVPTIAEKAHLSKTQLYRTLSPKGNPVLSSLSAILKAMGLRLAVQPVQP